ncbi:uncharacterized protein C12orf60 homolog [Tiliqua scincoides]|uniref:uncharacterized protein C12orf60 homolog n=1 Tax=Tiliqua scincoides TaxID=71010 RepID=UPI003462F2BE
MLSMFGSKEDQQRLLNASHTLYDCVYSFVSSSNIIFRILNQYLKTEFASVALKENLSIMENLQLLISALNEMQETVDSKAKDVHQHVSDPLYSKINLTTSSKEERTQLVKEISSIYTGAFSNVCGPIATVLFRHGNLPEKLEYVVQNLANCPVVALRVGDLLMNQGKIAEAVPEPTTSKSPSATLSGERVHGQSVATTAVSLTTLMQRVLQGHSDKNNSLALAANYMEDAAKVLKPISESFQSIVKAAEEYVMLIVEQFQ